MKNTKNILIIIAVVVVVVVILIWINPLKLVKKATLPRPVPEKVSSVSVPSPTSLPLTGLPKGLPANLPIEPNAQALFSYYGVVGATQQTTYRYTTYTPADKNLADYQEYFSSNGWSVGKTSTVGSAKTFSATKGGETVQAAFGAGNLAGAAITIVNLFFTKPVGN